jgi:hypothetical protein
MRKRSN